MVLAILRILIGSADHVHTSRGQNAGLNEVTTVRLVQCECNDEYKQVMAKYKTMDLAWISVR